MDPGQVKEITLTDDLPPVLLCIYKLNFKDLSYGRSTQDSKVYKMSSLQATHTTACL